MDIYYAVTNYHLLCCLLHKMKYNHNPATILISEYLLEIKPDIVEKITNTKIFESVIIIDKPTFQESDEFLDNKGLKNRITEINKKIKEKYAYLFEKSNELYICCDFDELGIYLINNKIKYNYFEDGCGTFSREHLVLKVVHERKKFIKELGCLGNNKNVVKRFGSLMAQDKGYNNPKDQDFSVKDILKKLSNSEINMLLNIYDIKKIKIGSGNFDLLLTMHYNEIMPQDMQRKIYTYLIDYFKEDDEKLIIKPHPADSIFNYKDIFKDAIELNRYMPSELFPYCIDKKFEKGITCWSTSIYGLGKIIKNIVSFDSRIDKTFLDFDKYYAIVQYLKKIKKSEKVYLNLDDSINEIQLIKLLEKYFSTYKRYYTFENTTYNEKINIVYDMKNEYEKEKTIIMNPKFNSSHFLSITKNYTDKSSALEFVGLNNFDCVDFNISKKMKYSKFILDVKVCSIYECVDALDKKFNNSIKSSETKIKIQKEKIEQLELELQQKNTEINNIYNSSSWKITKPMRKLMNLIRSIK